MQGFRLFVFNTFINTLLFFFKKCETRGVKNNYLYYINSQICRREGKLCHGLVGVNLLSNKNLNGTDTLSVLPPCNLRVSVVIRPAARTRRPRSRSSREDDSTAVTEPPSQGRTDSPQFEPIMADRPGSSTARSAFARRPPPRRSPRQPAQPAPRCGGL